MFVKEFLKAGRSWAPNFCDHWYNQKDAAGQPLELFEITRKYRVRVDEESKPLRGHAHVATLQGAPQPDASDLQQHHEKSCEIFTGKDIHSGLVMVLELDTYVSAKKVKNNIQIGNRTAVNEAQVQTQIRHRILL